MSKRKDPPVACPPDEGGQPPAQLIGLPRMWAGGWKRYIFPGIWLIYLAQTIAGVHHHSNGVGEVLGYLIVLAFATCYLAALPAGWTGSFRRFWSLYLTTLVLTAVETLFAHEDAFVFCVYIAVLTVASRARWAPVLVGALAVITGFAPLVAPSWSGSFDYSGALAVLLVSLAMFGFFSIIQSNIALAAARAEVARLAAENERSRIARDLHDLLGHSLTTITVKAGLARRLAEHGDADRSLHEITEVEQLSRRTLGDVRAAVAGHREVTLAGELATAREVLRAAAITAELPGSVDGVDPRYSELFGWVVREGVTNIVRHSRANRCTITLTERRLEITDDGRGGAAGTGSGLTGLRERVESAGGTLTARAAATGWELTVTMPPERGAASNADPADAETIRA
jgi:two-component system, NarL family, sensor histidine kinase DesK